MQKIPESSKKSEKIEKLEFFIIFCLNISQENPGKKTLEKSEKMLKQHENIQAKNNEKKSRIKLKKKKIPKKSGKKILKHREKFEEKIAKIFLLKSMFMESIKYISTAN